MHIFKVSHWIIDSKNAINQWDLLRRIINIMMKLQGFTGSLSHWLIVHALPCCTLKKQSHQPRQLRVLKVAKSVNWLTTKSSSEKRCFDAVYYVIKNGPVLKWYHCIYIHIYIYIYVYSNESWDLNPTNVTYNNLRGCFWKLILNESGAS